MTWDYGTVYQKESMRTTLSLVHPVDPECAGEVTVQVVGKLTDVKTDRQIMKRSTRPCISHIM